MAPNRDTAIAAALAGLAPPGGVAVRAWVAADFPAIQRLSEAEGWPTPRARPEESRAAWQRSWPALVATHGADVIGFVRALTDGDVTLFVPELLVVPAWRGRGIGRLLLDLCHALYPRTRIELLATASAAPFYEALGFRPLRGYRKRYR